MNCASPEAVIRRINELYTGTIGVGLALISLFQTFQVIDKSAFVCAYHFCRVDFVSGFVLGLFGRARFRAAGPKTISWPRYHIEHIINRRCLVAMCESVFQRGAVRLTIMMGSDARPLMVPFLSYLENPACVS
jgi:hypothetical protein